MSDAGFALRMRLRRAGHVVDPCPAVPKSGLTLFRVDDGSYTWVAAESPAHAIALVAQTMTVGERWGHRDPFEPGDPRIGQYFTDSVGVDLAAVKVAMLSSAEASGVTISCDAGPRSLWDLFCEAEEPDVLGSSEW